jgi:hypothetical protein
MTSLPETVDPTTAFFDAVVWSSDADGDVPLASSQRVRNPSLGFG